MKKQKKTWKCDQCEKSFYINAELQKHISVKHLKKTFACNQCSKPYSSDRGLFAHVKSFHEKIRYKCTFCSHEVVSKAISKLFIWNYGTINVIDVQIHIRVLRHSETMKMYSMTDLENLSVIFVKKSSHNLLTEKHISNWCILKVTK